MGKKDQTQNSIPSKGKHARASSTMGADATKAIPAAENAAYGSKTPTPTGGYRPMYNAATTGASGGRRPSKKAVIAIVATVAVIAMAYAGVGLFFSSHFYPSTTIGSHDISLMSASEVETLLDDAVSEYTLSVEGDGLEFELSSSDMGVSFDSQKLVASLLSYNNVWAWPLGLAQSHDETEHLALSTADTGVADLVRAEVEQFNATATPSQNATIAFDAETEQFEIVPEVFGTTLDVEKVVSTVGAAVAAMEPRVVLDEACLVTPDVTEGDELVVNACKTANNMVRCDVTFTVAGTSAATLSAVDIAAWITVGQDYAVTLDDGMVGVWADNVAGTINTYDSTRTYTRADGKVCSVSGGVYGWIVDKETLTANARDYVNNGTVGTYEMPMTQIAGAFNGVGQADWGSRYVDVDLSEQHAYFYDGGSVIWEADIVSGKPDGEHNTPTGVYTLNGKQSPSTLIGTMVPETGEPEYETKVAFWMPFVGNAVGFHDATWQPGFGGSLYTSIGSHGCVNLSYSSAEALYGIIQSGDVVVVHS